MQPTGWHVQPVLVPDPTNPEWTVFIPLGSALLGASVGAFLSQRIVARNKSIEDRLKEVRAAHAAAALTYSAVTDVFLNVKKQNIKPTYDRYEISKTIFLWRARYREPGEIVDFTADMQTMDVVRVPLDALQKILVERVNTPTRALALMAVLDRTVHGLNNYLKMRNAMCDEFRKNGVKPQIYYGLRTETGADERYSSAIKAIQSYTDDAIHFSKELGDELMVYANAEKAKLPWRQRRSSPIIVSADFSKAAEMFPDRKNYLDWDTMFVRPLPPPPWWKLWERSNSS